MKQTMRQQRIEAARTLAKERWGSNQTALFDDFLSHYLASAASEDLVEQETSAWLDAASAHWQLGEQRAAGALALALRNPESDHTVVQIVSDDKPFLVDSLSIAINELGLIIHLINHPVLAVERDQSGIIRGVEPGGRNEETPAEAWIHIEVDRQSTDEQLHQLEQALRSALSDVEVAVTDWQAMREQARLARDELLRQPPELDPDALEEISEFIDWMVDEHFTFLGYRCYDLHRDGKTPQLKAIDDSGLGLLRETRAQSNASERFAALPSAVQAEAFRPDPLILTKSSHRATVHRPGYMDTIGIKRFNEQGEVIGEHRFLGLYTSSAYSRDPRSIPLLRRKVETVIKEAGLRRGSHAGKALAHILATYPRDELFQVDVETLKATAFGILELQERQRVRLFLRYDRFGRFVSCLVFAPRDRYDTSVRQKMQQILMQRLNGADSEFSVQMTEAVLARIHFIVHLADFRLNEIDEKALEAELAATTRSWSDDLSTALLKIHPGASGRLLQQRYGEAFSAAYREDNSPDTAAADIQQLERLPEQKGLAISLYRPAGAEAGELRLKLYHAGEPISLSDVLPVLENMGVRVIDERPYGIEPADGEPCWIHDFGLSHDPALQLDAGSLRETFQQAFAAIWHGETDNDGFHRLILRSGLGWRDISILRAYTQYLRQAGSAYSQPYFEETLAANANIARALVALFHCRMDPDNADPQRATALTEEIETELDRVESLDEDRILRRLLAAMNATLRTNFYRLDDNDHPRDYIAFKLNPADIPGMPKPIPAFEIFVSSPRLEGVHLRGGKVARGGLRWSDRREDYRTEVLGLMKAQMVKNALIVPVGAKGGFVCKQLPADRAEQREEVLACYRLFIQALLDVTDNIVNGDIEPPPRVVRHDDDDPYLVVAADKGTATFSDEANAIAEARGFWLRDAFASGGSTGYDHKKMGITARGAWVAVQRHFRELGRNIQETPFTAVGIGDMSGDVFGNGMLQSPCTRLIAAFDHRHIFIDPDPDPARSYAERQRLFALERSSWADYDTDCLSSGGGIWPRSAKSIRLSVAARNALGIDEEQLPPNELIQAILRAPVDLLWNGGIGTYIKAADERDIEVDDKTNDPVRVDAEDLRCQVIGEGGNLGVTARGRIAFALNGGRINTDAIDNAGGVDCSDHEVNIKILLNRAVDEGELTFTARNRLLARMTDSVADLVLANNYRQTQALSLMSERAVARLSEQARCMRLLEREGRLDRAVEQLPDDEALAERERQGLGLTRPELSILLAYSKIRCYETLLDADLIDRPENCTALIDYFPAALRSQFAERIEQHPLRREIIATRLANHVLNRMGATFLQRLEEATGSQHAVIIQAYLSARDIYGLGPCWHQIDGLDNRVATTDQHDLLQTLCRAQERATQWLLTHPAEGEDPADRQARLTSAVKRVDRMLPDLLAEADEKRLAQAIADDEAAGIPQTLSRQVRILPLLYTALDISEAATRCDATLKSAAYVHFSSARVIGLDRLQHNIQAFTPDNDWEVRFRSGMMDALDEQRRRITENILKHAHGRSLQKRLEQWSEHHAGRIEHLQQLIDQIDSAAQPEAAMIGVALQSLRNLGIEQEEASA